MRLLTAALLSSILLVSATMQTKPIDHSPETIKKFGWTAVPHSQTVLLKDISPWDPAEYTVADIKIPDSEIAKKVLQYAKDRLPEQTFNHSIRVYYYGEDSPLRTIKPQYYGKELHLTQ